MVWKLNVRIFILKTYNKKSDYPSYLFFRFLEKRRVKYIKYQLLKDKHVSSN